MQEVEHIETVFFFIFLHLKLEIIKNCIILHKIYCSDNPF